MIRTRARFRFKRTGAFLAPLLLCVVAAARAQDGTMPDKLASDLSKLSFDELADLSIDSVYAASAYAQKITEAPSSVTIVTQDDIDRFGYRTLADILRGVRGFYVTNDRNYSYLGVRGFSRPGDYNARVLLLVDGHRLNDNIFGSALIGTEFPLDIDLIERVEIIRGPSSSLYGTSAFFAVINVITQSGDHLKGVDASGTFGTFDARRGRASVGQSFTNGAQMLVSASAYASSGQAQLYFPEFDSPETDHGVARNVDSDEYTHLLGKFKAGHFTLQALHGSRAKVVPTASFGTVFNDPRSRTVETQQYVDLQYDRSLGSEWHAGGRVYLDRYAYDGTYVFEHEDETGPIRVPNQDFARGSWWGSEIKLRRQLARRHTLAFGSEYRNNFRQDQYNYDAAPYFQYLNDQRSSTNWALFIQDEIKLHDKVLVNLGVRHDEYDTFGGTTNPRAALIYNPVSKTTLKLLYGGAFRAPNAYELFWFQPDVAKANPALSPETNRTSEVVLEQALTSALHVGATAFSYSVHDLITQQTDPTDDLLVYNNVDRIEARGLELEVEGKWTVLGARASYTYQHSQNKQTSQALTNSPAHVAQFRVTAPLTRRGLFVGFETRYLSARQTISGNKVASVVVPNLTIFRRRQETGLEIQASLFNLFDNRYTDPGSEEHRQDGIIQPGRTGRISLTYRFRRGI